MAKRKARDESDHAAPVATIAGALFRGAGPTVRGTSRKRPVLDADGCVVVPREVIDMSTRTPSARPLPDDPYYLDG